MRSRITVAILMNWLAGVILLWSLAIGAQASPGEEAANAVRVSTDALMMELNANRDVFYSDPNAFYAIMEDALDDVVDFRRIAARVMGRYRRDASDDQKEAFVEVFKRSLFSAYGKTLVESGEFEVRVLNGEVDARNEERANVNLQVVSASGNTYPVVYAMYKNESRGWLLENVIVNGVNVGLAFREKFEQQYTQSRGNIDTVIREWTKIVEEADVVEGSQS